MKYVAQNFKDGEVLRADQLNHMEAGITQLFESNEELSEKIPMLLDKDIAIEASLKSLSEADKSTANQIKELSEADKNTANQIKGLSEKIPDPDAYIKKLTPHQLSDQVPVTRNLTYGDGEETSYFLSKSANKTSKPTIPLRKEDGNIAVPLTPSADGDAACKKYVDDHIGGGSFYKHTVRVRYTLDEADYSTDFDFVFEIVNASSEPYSDMGSLPDGSYIATGTFSYAGDNFVITGVNINQNAGSLPTVYVQIEEWGSEALFEDYGVTVEDTVTKL